jgi:hypothetical protein
MFRPVVMDAEIRGNSTVSDGLNRGLAGFVRWACGLIIATYSFLSYWYYSQEFHLTPQNWTTMLAGKAEAPAQYRIGGLFLADFISRLLRGHLAIRHILGLLDGIYLTVGIIVLFTLLRNNPRYQAMSSGARVATEFLAIGLILYYLSWTFWYHKMDTLANFACLSMGAVIVAGKSKMRGPLAVAVMMLVSGFLATHRAESGMALNAGIVAVALLPGTRVYPLGRITQLTAGVAGLATDLGVEFYITHVMFPNARFGVSTFQLIDNLRQPESIFVVLVALAPWFVAVWLALQQWRALEVWEAALLVAAFVEFGAFVVVAMMDEVRLFLPYPMVLVPLSAVFLVSQLVGESSGVENDSQP